MKKALALVLVLIFTLALVPAAAAYDYSVIECYHPACPGYCYVYDQPDDMNGRNLGRMDNGTEVTVYNYTSTHKGGWYYISGYNTKGKFVYGYVHYYSIRGGTDIVENPPLPPSSGVVVRCLSDNCPGYCYVYKTPDCIYGQNLGRMNNGTPVTVLCYTSNNQGGWYQITGYNTKGSRVTGYVHNFSLSCGPVEDQYAHTTVDCDYGDTCIVYEWPDSSDGIRQLGVLTNGTHVVAYNFTGTRRGGWYFVSGVNTKNKKVYGYVRENTLAPNGKLKNLQNIQ